MHTVCLSASSHRASLEPSLCSVRCNANKSELNSVRAVHVDVFSFFCVSFRSLHIHNRTACNAWQTHMHSDTNDIGRTWEMNEIKNTIIALCSDDNYVYWNSMNKSKRCTIETNDRAKEKACTEKRACIKSHIIATNELTTVIVNNLYSISTILRKEKIAK